MGSGCLRMSGAVVQDPDECLDDVDIESSRSIGTSSHMELIEIMAERVDLSMISVLELSEVESVALVDMEC